VIQLRKKEEAGGKMEVSQKKKVAPVDQILSKICPGLQVYLIKLLRIYRNINFQSLR